MILLCVSILPCGTMQASVQAMEAAEQRATAVYRR
jgi:hypothetical protein